MEPTVDNDDPASESEREKTEDEGARTDGAESVRKAEGTVTDISSPTGDAKDVFDGYSFKGRHSVIIDEEDYEGYADEEEEGEDEELIEARKITDALAARHQQPAEPKEDTSETGTIEQNKAEPSVQEAISATPSTSTVPESAVSASIVTDGESVVAPKAPKDERKQASESTERSSTIPSLTTGTTTMSSSKELTESPTIAESFAQSAAAARLIAEGSFDEAVQAPLPLSPVLEAIDPATGAIEDEPLSAPAPAPSKPEEVKPAPSTPVPSRLRQTRREKSGIPVLDRLRREEDEDATEKDEDDWDLVEAPAMQERNGAKGLNLWQRGVVDRYRLAVFRKSGAGNTPSRIPRSVSGATHDSQNTAAEASASPSPSQAKHKRGRTGGISLRKSTRDFLRAKSPSANFSTQSSATSRTSVAQGSNGAGLLTPSPSVPAMRTKPVPSLKSKSSALSKASVNSPPSSDQSVTDLRNQHAKSSADVSVSTPVKSPLMSPRSLAMRSSPAVDEGDHPRPSNLKKMKKYTEQGAEKMFSLFGSPRNQNQQHHS